MGRLFDAAAALCGVRATVSYEGQAAVELEAACDSAERGRYPIELVSSDEMIVLDPREAVKAIASDFATGVPVGVIASRFHNTIALGTTEACQRAASARATDVVVLSGGVFQNRRLMESVAAGLDAAGLRVLTPELLPANDGGIAYGQAVIAARQSGAAR
jgi:hydrogenase maturation protein HypF